LDYTNLGGTDEKISVIGFGGWPIGGHGYGVVDDSQSVSAIRKALDLGINIFDTADVYGFGHSEELLAKALGGRIGNVVVATKFGVRWDETGKTVKDCSPTYMRKALEGSLRRLKTDCIPLYQLHRHDGVTPLSDVFEALNRIQEEGKIRFIGCSNIPSPEFRDSSAARNVVSAQLQFSLVYRQSSKDLDVYHQEYGMATMAYGVLTRGLLSGKYGKNSSFAERDTRRTDPGFLENLACNDAVIERIRNVSTKYNKTACQVAIRWVLENPSVSCALVGIKSQEQIIENAGAVGWSLNKEDTDYLDSLNS
jgi:aryl-alcohol dehydrogenase-like predicted oxidoreductase